MAKLKSKYPGLITIKLPKKPIRTASDAQAREKIYSSSIDSWRNYENNLKKFFNKNK